MQAFAYIASMIANDAILEIVFKICFAGCH